MRFFHNIMYVHAERMIFKYKEYDLTLYLYLS